MGATKLERVMSTCSRQLWRPAPHGLPQRALPIAHSTWALLIVLLAFAAAPTPCGAPEPPVGATAAQLTLNVPAFRAAARVMLTDMLNRVRAHVDDAWRSAPRRAAPRCHALRCLASMCLQWRARVACDGRAHAVSH